MKTKILRRVSEEVYTLNNLDDIIHIDGVVVVDANDSEDFIVETFVPTEDVEVVEVQEVIPSIIPMIMNGNQTLQI